MYGNIALSRIASLHFEDTWIKSPERLCSVHYLVLCLYCLIFCFLSQLWRFKIKMTEKCEKNNVAIFPVDAYPLSPLHKLIRVVAFRWRDNIDDGSNIASVSALSSLPFRCEKNIPTSVHSFRRREALMIRDYAAKSLIFWFIRRYQKICASFIISKLMKIKKVTPLYSLYSDESKITWNNPSPTTRRCTFRISDYCVPFASAAAHVCWKLAATKLRAIKEV